MGGVRGMRSGQDGGEAIEWMQSSVKSWAVVVSKEFAALATPQLVLTTQCRIVCQQAGRESGVSQSVS